MNSKLCMEKISIFIIGISFIVTTFISKSGAYSILSYIMFVIAFLIIWIKIALKKNKISNKQKKKIFIFLFIISFIELLSAMKYSLRSTDIISMLSAFLIPLFITYNYYLVRYTCEMYKNIFYVWTLSEIVLLIIFISKVGFSSDFNSVAIMRQYVQMWPNHFAMISVIKIAIYFLINDEYKTKSKMNKYLIPSLITILISQSRTALVMLVVTVIINIIVKNKFNFKKVILLIICVIFILSGVKITVSNKGSMGNNSLKHTMESRESRWSLINMSIKDDLIIGNGFRSVTKFIYNNTGVDIGSSHNDYLDTLLKGGILYFGIVYYYIISAIFLTVKNKKFNYTNIIVIIMLAGITQNPLKNYIIQFIFYFVISDIYIQSESDEIKSGKLII